MMSDIRPESSSERVPLANLDFPELANIRFLESETDKVFHLRNQLAKFLRTYRKYLRSEKDQGEIRRAHVEDINDAYNQSRSTASIEPFIDWEKVDEDALNINSDFPLGEEDLARSIYRDQVLEEFEIALQNYAYLKDYKGEWTESSGKSDPETTRIREYYHMRWGELGEAISTIDAMEQQRVTKEKALEALKSRMVIRPSISLIGLINKYESEIHAINKSLKDIAISDPNAYFYVHGKVLTEARNTYDQNGRIIETPYVKMKIARIMEFLGHGKPVFIHGELGSGKTELLLHIARTRLSDKHIGRWEIAHPRPTDPDELQKWEVQRDHEREPLFLAGHRGVEVEQMIGTRTIKRSEMPSPELQARTIAEGWEQYQREMFEYALENKTDNETTTQFNDWVDNQKRLYETAYQELYRSPVVAEVAFGPLLKAMREGRPYIEDETNAIPHHLQIVKNDLLNRRVGDWVQPNIPGAEPFQVQDGFAYLSSGNYKPEDGAVYIGRQAFDAAYLSRFGIVQYDYLPMQHALEAAGLPIEEQRHFREQNELYHMLVARLVESDLTLTVPENTFENKTLYRLAMMGRNIQDIFSGLEMSNAWYANVGAAKVKPQDVLKENVLSIRHMLSIVDAWQRDGFTKDLDYYIYHDYINRSSARPEEMVYLYQMLQTQGDFFPTSKGWPAGDERDDIRSGRLRRGNISYTVEQFMYDQSGSTQEILNAQGGNSSIGTYAAQAVIEELYGPAPERTSIPARYFGQFNTEGQDTQETAMTNLAEARERQRMVDRLRSLKDSLSGSGYEL